MKKVPTNIYSRVCGFFTSVSGWNSSKKSEFADRKTFDVNNKKKNYPKWNKKDLT